MSQPPRSPVVVVAPDSFKGSLGAAQASGAISAGVHDVLGPDAAVVQRPMADGGEGTLSALLDAWHVQPRRLRTLDPLGRPVSAAYGVSPDGRTGVVELAEASGLTRVADVSPQPLRADTFGTGLVAAALLDAGVEEILLCLGGSASTDGGTGILTALGARFLDAAGHDVAPGGCGLAQVAHVDDSGLQPRARAVRWRLAVDVSNPLTGPRGSAAVFGPQKGATPADVAALDDGLARLATVLGRHADAWPADRPGAGAAGGVPLTLVTLLGAELTPGARLVAQALELPAALARADLLITGEGCLDGQSLHGKVVGMLATLAARHGDAAVVALAGSVRLSPAELRDGGIDAAFSIADGPAAEHDLMGNAASLLRSAAARVTSLVFRGRYP